MSETFSVQLTAVATLALAVLALATAVLAFMAWRKQSREVSDQAEELRQVSAERDREAREKAPGSGSSCVHVGIPSQAEVAGKATPDMTLEAYVRNTSPQPIYDVEFE